MAEIALARRCVKSTPAAPARVWPIIDRRGRAGTVAVEADAIVLRSCAAEIRVPRGGPAARGGSRHADLHHGLPEVSLGPWVAEGEAAARARATIVRIAGGGQEITIGCPRAAPPEIAGLRPFERAPDATIAFEGFVDLLATLAAGATGGRGASPYRGERQPWPAPTKVIEIDDLRALEPVSAADVVGVLAIAALIFGVGGFFLFALPVALEWACLLAGGLLLTPQCHLLVVAARGYATGSGHRSLFALLALLLVGEVVAYGLYVARAPLPLVLFATLIFGLLAVPVAAFLAAVACDVLARRRVIRRAWPREPLEPSGSSLALAGEHLELRASAEAPAELLLRDEVEVEVTREADGAARVRLSAPGAAPIELVAPGRSRRILRTVAGEAPGRAFAIDGDEVDHLLRWLARRDDA